MLVIGENTGIFKISACTRYWYSLICGCKSLKKQSSWSFTESSITRCTLLHSLKWLIMSRSEQAKTDIHWDWRFWYLFASIIYDIVLWASVLLVLQNWHIYYTIIVSTNLPRCGSSSGVTVVCKHYNSALLQCTYVNMKKKETISLSFYSETETHTCCNL